MRSASADSSAATRSGWSQGSWFIVLLRNALVLLLPLKGKASGPCRHPVPSRILREQRDHFEMRRPFLARYGFRGLHGEAGLVGELAQVIFAEAEVSVAVGTDYTLVLVSVQARKQNAATWANTPPGRAGTASL